MNKLSYGLLSFLSTEPMTGYDLMLKLNQFWRTTHSAIYPLLAELEEKQYVIYTLVGQNSKPDKKVYEITEPGREVLKGWISSPTDEAVRKDEMMLKIYCIQGFDGATIEKLINEMEERYQKQLIRYTESLNKLISGVNNKFDSFKSQGFGSYLLLEKAICDVKLSIRWCKWIRDIYNRNKEIDCTHDNFRGFQEN
ncbi:PadR family transcriptional regulator [Clostridium sp. BNL1100]|uniref:PadR family transcriptional regulator n=1 Tax=Clostridium sp. BNL1100 TaxID=755731 RepID=UPI00024A7166|nr:PadR family transcriptional regulator [Clostridium sp. BNL1100]AEY66304.1 putative transcriptional regulator [Clostridium sp. BNL1100]